MQSCFAHARSIRATASALATRRAIQASAVSSLLSHQSVSIPTTSYPCLDRHHVRSYAATVINSSSAESSPGLRHKAYIALGSNLGNKIEMIENACKIMEKDGNIKIRRTSSLYETEPMYVEDQGKFLNGVCEIYTSLGPAELLERLKAIEDILGRVKSVDKGPRSIDLDILLYGDTTYQSDSLTIPHKLMLERQFVLKPLCDILIAGQLPHSSNKLTFRDHLRRLEMRTKSPIRKSVVPLKRDRVQLSLDRRNEHTRLMSILNVTPDSFSDGGVNNPENRQEMASTVLSHIKAGTDVIDVGGQSSRPSATPVTAEEEIARAIPIIEIIRSLPEAKDIPISIDTYRAAVAKAAVHAGADMVNDISSGMLDKDMLPTIAKLGCTVSLMHMRGDPKTMHYYCSYPEGVIYHVQKELRDHLDAAQRAGIRRWRTILDPGLGFSKTQEQNVEILRSFENLRSGPGLQGIPWLAGPSRKRFIGRATGIAEPKMRGWGTAAAVTAAIAGGADMVRIHDVSEMRMVANMADAIWRPTIQ